MPRGDGTGPAGQGAGTGRGLALAEEEEDRGDQAWDPGKLRMPLMRYQGRTPGRGTLL